MIIEVTNNNYNEYVEDNKDIVILEFGAKNCGPCKILNSVLEDIEEKNDHITIGKVDIEDNPNIAIKFGVMSVPYMVILKQNKVIQKIVGLKDKEFVEKIINSI